MHYPESECVESSPNHTIIRADSIAHAIHLCHGKIHPHAAIWLDIDGVFNRHPKQSIREASGRMLRRLPLPRDVIPEMLALSINCDQAAQSVVALRQMAPGSSIYFLTARVDGYQNHPHSRRSIVFRRAARMGGQEPGFNWKQQLTDAIIAANPTLAEELAIHSIAPDMFPRFLQYIDRTQDRRRSAIVTNFPKDGFFERDVLPIVWGDKTPRQAGISHVPEALAALVAESPELVIFDDKEKSITPIVATLPGIRVTQFVIGRYSHYDPIPVAISLR